MFFSFFFTGIFIVMEDNQRPHSDQLHVIVVRTMSWLEMKGNLVIFKKIKKKKSTKTPLNGRMSVVENFTENIGTN